jgi:hypothetical protein
MQTIVELPEFLREAEKVLGDNEKSGIIDTLARNPTIGVLITGTGGIRKLRWARPGSGKSSGVRVIYYYHNQSMPLFLLTLFAKGEKPNLSKSERNELAQLARILRSQYAGKGQ